jgi:hypothetical protein
VGLYEEPERPTHAVDYIKRYMGAPVNVDVEALKVGKGGRKGGNLGGREGGGEGGTLQATLWPEDVSFLALSHISLDSVFPRALAFISPSCPLPSTSTLSSSLKAEAEDLRQRVASLTRQNQELQEQVSGGEGGR